MLFWKKRIAGNSKKEKEGKSKRDGPCLIYASEGTQNIEVTGPAIQKGFSRLAHRRATRKGELSVKLHGAKRTNNVNGTWMIYCLSGRAHFVDMKG